MLYYLKTKYTIDLPEENHQVDLISNAHKLNYLIHLIQTIILVKVDLF